MPCQESDRMCGSLGSCPHHGTRPVEGQQAMMRAATNRDEGSYKRSLAYDHFLDTASSRRVNNRKN